ncbi:class I SAM-dependent methyltransferase [Bailinhaonella thermotolerans]|uniref:class I SAM-dependent methyltransferase n=1 Tax=Bailinhaonella thermotolerans TaxID=1070861 RepID=UPI001F5BBE89|nr:methyltransferase domain-containing protein [Bailinhaonella thermotolerans]
MTSRTAALRNARVRGTPAEEVIAELARRQNPHGLIADIGCGRGTTTLALARALPTCPVAAVDSSAPLLAQARSRTRGHRVQVVAGDFHALPLRTRSAALAVAAFCLYHSATPAAALSELRRCLRPGGVLIAATKSTTSYRELDQLIAASGLDPEAASRPSLYRTVHSGNLDQLVHAALTVRYIRHDEHVFRFDDLDQVAAYLATSPKYHLPSELLGHPEALTRALKNRLPNRPITTTSTVTYVIGVRDE